MKKILTLFAVVGLFAFSSCEGDQGPEGPPGRNVNEVFEIFNADFGFNATDGYNISGNFNPLLADADTVLIYRLAGTIDANTPIWQLIPRTIYLSNNRELDYDYDFSREDYKIYAAGNYDEATTPDLLDNQTFRIVIVPGTFTDKSTKKPDYSDYYAVIKKYGIDDTNVKRLN
ncbi:MULTISPECIES: hypothetical protein [unclassified Flavobacterium]|uniref:hypothetical protein n=1 Tax=unclassified Flavobacterium TaxID=196869 RepID=UPI0006ABC330|nr:MULTISPECIES: hypothetical protein [unclassified Flavobacterium]KOP36069.1 hypothetical protein AKO67_21940 [Flavobacterium sp. VMW]OWU89371.1 hypothetical protein APR43_19455 [Flavobacterium sp. NLM]